MITQELVQRVQKLVNVYNQTHEEQFTITYHNNLYRLTHSDVPKLELFINYFNSSKNPDDTYIQTAFETVTKLIAIYNALNKTFQAEHPFFYKDCIGIHEGNHKTILKPSSNQTVMVEQKLKLYPLDNGVQVKHYYKYNLKQTMTYSLDKLDMLSKIAILP